MKFGMRKPSFKKRIAARTSLKRHVRHSLGLKAPRGWGWLQTLRKQHTTEFITGQLSVYLIFSKD